MLPLYRCVGMMSYKDVYCDFADHDGTTTGKYFLLSDWFFHDYTDTCETISIFPVDSANNPAFRWTYTGQTIIHRKAQTFGCWSRNQTVRCAYYNIILLLHTSRSSKRVFRVSSSVVRRPRVCTRKLRSRNNDAHDKRFVRDSVDNDDIKIITTVSQPPAAFHRDESWVFFIIRFRPTNPPPPTIRQALTAGTFHDNATILV